LGCQNERAFAEEYNEHTPTAEDRSLPKAGRKEKDVNIPANS